MYNTTVLGAGIVANLPPWEMDNFPEDLVCIGIVGIKDPLRDEVRYSILLMFLSLYDTSCKVYILH